VTDHDDAGRTRSLTTRQWNTLAGGQLIAVVFVLAVTGVVVLAAVAALAWLVVCALRGVLEALWIHPR
jgi:hypothetical protein